MSFGNLHAWKSRQTARDAERWLDALDPKAIASPDADASHLRRIGTSRQAAQERYRQPAERR